MSAIQDELTICCREQWQPGIRFQVICAGDSLRLAADSHAGAYCLPPVDSGETQFAWSRLHLDAVLPQDCSLHLYAYASDEADWPAWDTLRDMLANPQTAGPSAALQACFGQPLPSGTDVWLSCTGRYLWLAAALTATGGGVPEIRALSLRMAGDHMLDYLPAIYRGQDFTARYLSIFNSMLQDLEDAVEALPRQLYAASADAEMLRELAGWLCLPPDTDNLRQCMQTALTDFETQYTPAGVARSVYRLAGRQPLLIEHFAVDPNRADCCDPDLYRRLYGDTPYRFFILLDEDTFDSRDQMEWFLTQMRMLVPAGMEPELVLLRPCIQLGWHTYLGINSRVGSYTPAVIDETVTIHYDTTIGGATS